MAYDTAVVGGGLSGMIAALELANAGERVVLYEAKSELGGLATYDCEYGDAFYNLQHVVRHHLGKAWPTIPTSVVVFPRVPFHVPLSGGLRLLKAMLTPNIQTLRGVSWYASDADDAAIRYPFHRDIPVSTVTRYVEMVVEHALRTGRLATSRVPMQSTREYILDPLRRRLEEMGVEIRFNTPATSLSPKALDAHTVVSAIPPDCYAKLHDTTGLYGFAVKKMIKLADESQYPQMCFTLYFKESLEPLSGMDLRETAWGLRILPNYSDNAWSGTCTYMHRRDTSGRLAAESSFQQFKESVIQQIGDCRELVEHFFDNGIDLVEQLDTLVDFKVNNAWTSETMESPLFMTLDSYKETWLRPVAGSKIGARVHVAGAHAGTGCEIWSLESAAEAGKRAAIAVLQSKGKENEASKVFVDCHERHPLRFAMLGLGLLTATLSLVFAVLYK